MIFLAVGLFSSVCGCRTAAPPEPALQRYDFTHPAMGTLFTINLFANNEASAESAAAAAFARIDALEDVMSDYQADSELMRLCDQPYGTAVPVSDDLFDIIQLSQRIARSSDGAFDITVGPYVRLWRFSRKRKTLPPPADLAKARAAVGWQKLRLDETRRTVTLLAPEMRLDLGGIGKGYSADQALQVLKGRGITRALVAASGDIAIGDPPPGHAGWKIGIAAYGTRTNEIARQILLRNAGISTSGDSEQFIEIGGVRYSHIVDPRTGLGLTERIQDTVIGPNATVTDSLDTAVNVLGADAGMKFVEATPKTAAVISRMRDGKVEVFVSRRYGALAAACSR